MMKNDITSICDQTICRKVKLKFLVCLVRLNSEVYNQIKKHCCLEGCQDLIAKAILFMRN